MYTKDLYIPKKPIPDAISIGEIVKLSKRLNTKPAYKAIMYFSYLSASRVTEALYHKAEDLVETEHEGQEILLFHQLYTLKNRRYRHRNVPVLIDDQDTKEMRDYLMAYASLREQKDLLFPGISRQMVYNNFAYGPNAIKFNVSAIKLFKDKAPKVMRSYPVSLNPHYLRHCRLTHLVKKYNYNSDKLMRIAGWSDPKQALTYVRMNWRDLAEPMIKASHRKIIKRRLGEKKNE